MSTLPRPERRLDHTPKRRAAHRFRDLARRCRGCLPLALAAVLGATGSSPARAQDNPQKAIERLEGCSAQERKSGCVNILKRRKSGDGQLAIKAQVRGSRIIWYEYDTRTGAVRRTN